VNRIPLRRLAAGPPPAPDRIFFHSLWFRGHNNPRYAELLPRLSRLDRYLITVGEGRIRRGLAYRALRATRHLRDPLLLALASRRYRYCFATHPPHVPLFSGRIVADVDDPTFSPQEVAYLSRPNVAAYVVTAERAGRRLRELGVGAPYHVVPQGVSLRSVRPDAIARARGARENGTVIVGYMAAWLLTSADRDGDNPLYNVDHLLELWDEIHRRAPEARLWLIGGASDRLRTRCAGRRDIRLLGRLPRPDALAHVGALDMALYPRTADQGIQSAKVAEYMGLGVPTVSYDFEVTAELRETGAGVLVPAPREFVDAVVRLVRDVPARASLAAAARTAGAERDWDVLARRYESEILDRYLPP
jgi:glycosyltransferase involved in cell wall biosynthesis